MTEESEDNLAAPLDEAALNEEASRELEAMVAAEEPAVESEASEDAQSYVVQNAAERRGIIEALIFVSEEPLGAKVIAEVLREDRAVVEEALDKRKHVHSAYFMLVEGGTHLSMMTVYDGDFEAYVEHFAIDVPLFDEQLKYLKDAPPLPTSKYPKQFVEWIDKHNMPPFGGYFYSAYPTLTVADIENAKKAGETAKKAES